MKPGRFSPGFQKLKGEACGPEDRPPLATCVNETETDGTKTMALVGVILSVLLIIGAAGSG